MAIKKLTNPAGYRVDIRPAGRDGRRFRKTFASRAEAIRYEKYIISEHKDPDPWDKPENDTRRLSELAARWFELHGRQLKSGRGRMSELNKVISLLGDPVATSFTAKAYTDFRAQTLKDVTANTANHDLAYLRSLFNELRRLGEWPYPNPISDVRKIKIDESELTFLNDKQIASLLAELDKSPSSHARISARLCLATGARWGETATLKPHQVQNQKVTFNRTKNGKSRSVPISKGLEGLIQEHAPLVDGMNTFKRAIAKLDFELPKGQMTHVLRHTFASHFMINGGNILTLQRVLGHGNITMTMRYAHLAPDHLNEALKLNPLDNRKN